MFGRLERQVASIGVAVLVALVSPPVAAAGPATIDTVPAVRPGQVIVFAARGLPVRQSVAVRLIGAEGAFRLARSRSDARGVARVRARVPMAASAGAHRLELCARERCAVRAVRRISVQVPPSRSSGVFGIYLGTDNGYQGMARQLGDVVSARNLGARVVSVVVYWSEVEEQRDVYRFEAYDPIIRAIHANGMEANIVLMGSPSWACTGPVNPMYGYAACGPRSEMLDEYEQFAGIAAARYAVEATRWQNWDEPNTEFYSPHPDIPLYAELQRRMFRAVRANDPTATVLLGGTPDGWNLSEHEPPAQGFAARLLAEFNGEQPFDAVAIHEFRKDPRTAEQIERPDQSMVQLDLKGALLDFRDVFTSRGYPAPDVYVTSVGWYVREGVTPALQAEYLSYTLELLASDPELSFVRSAYVYNIRDGASAESGETAGLLFGSGEWKPAAHAFRVLARRYSS